LAESFRARLRYFQTFLVLALAAAFLTACQTSDTLEIKPSYASAQPDRFASVVVDGRSGKILYQANQDAIRYPASLTKMMTLYLLFEALESGRITKSTLIPVSANAASQAPSKIGLKAGETIDVDTAIRAVTVKSANDIAVAIAELLGGTEDQFAVRMTSKARALGMNSTTFRNASGLHDPAQVTSAMDMARLGLSLRKTFPQYFSYFSLRECTINGRLITGHNKALDMISGANGIKTGYTKASGFNLVTSVERNGGLVVAVIMGEDSARTRDARMAMLVRAKMGG
jgi:D-alanyl-D-alanine carboxypeptidase